jgi:hypothetical protein
MFEPLEKEFRDRPATLSGALWMLLSGVPVALMGGYVLGWTIGPWVPEGFFGYDPYTRGTRGLELGLPTAAAAGLGFVIRRASRAGKNRSARMAAAVAIACAAIMVATALLVAEYPLITWLGGGLVIIVPAVSMAVATFGIEKQPFCERDRQFKLQRMLYSIPRENQDEALKLLASRDFEGLRSMHILQPRDHRCEITLVYCPTCLDGSLVATDKFSGRDRTTDTSAMYSSAVDVQTVRTLLDQPVADDWTSSPGPGSLFRSRS